MAFIHHGTIKKYTAVMLNIFNDLEVQYKDSNGVMHYKNIPITFSSVEKAKKLDDLTVEQLISGNYNVLPRASLSLDAVLKSEQRNTNKNIKINKVKNSDSYDYQYNSVAYDFVYELTIQCRGMNEATMILEQIAPKFNPILCVDIYDGLNLEQPTRIPIKLMDFTLSHEEYDEFSANIVTISCGFTVVGNLYPPIKTIDRIKEFKLQIKEKNEDITKKVIMGWDVDNEGKLYNEEIINAKNASPDLIDIVCSSFIKVGENELTLLYKDNDSLISELFFEWDVLLGDANLTFTKDKALLTINSPGEVQILVTVKDETSNVVSLTKTFNT